MTRGYGNPPEEEVRNQKHRKPDGAQRMDAKITEKMQEVLDSEGKSFYEMFGNLNEEPGIEESQTLSLLAMLYGVSLRSQGVRVYNHGKDCEIVFRRRNGSLEIARVTDPSRGRII